MKISEILGLNFYKVVDRMKFYGDKMTEGELIQVIKEIQARMNDKTPAFKRVSKSGERVTIYNSLGIQIGVNLPANEFKELESVHIHRQFIFAGENERKIIKELKIKLCHIYRLPVFRNGNFYAETKVKLNELLK